MPGRNARNAAASATPAWAEIIDLLRQAGANEYYHLLPFISVSRAANNFTYSVFNQGTNNDNRFTLLEVLGSFYASTEVTDRNAPPQRKPSGLEFPDFSRLKVLRLSAKPGETNSFLVDLSTFTRTNATSKDLGLEWGDVIEIPALDYKINESWPGLSEETEASWQRCLSRKVTIQVKGQKTRVALAPLFPAVHLPRITGFNNSNPLLTVPLPPLPGQEPAPQPTEPSEIKLNTFWLNQVVRNANVLLASSDTTRVKVTRANPDPGQAKELVLNLDTLARPDDLWLRDGDQIEIPEKP